MGYNSPSMREGDYVCANLNGYGTCHFDILTVPKKLLEKREELKITYDKREVDKLTSLISALEWMMAHNRANLADPESSWCTAVKKPQYGGYLKHLTVKEVDNQRRCGGYVALYKSSIRIRR